MDTVREIAGHPPDRLVRLAAERDVRRFESFPPGGAAGPDQPFGLARDHPLEAPEVARRAREPGVGPVHFLLGRGLEQHIEPDRVGPVTLHHGVGVHDVALALRHLGAVLDDHALAQLADNRLVVRNEAQVAHHPGPEAAVDEVQDGVLHAADVEVNGKPGAHPFRIERGAAVRRIEVAVEVPGRVHEGVHGVRLPAGGAAAGGAVHPQPGLDPGKGRPAHAGDLHIAGQLDRQVLLGDRDFAAGDAVDHRDRGAPVALAGDPPVAESPGDLRPAVTALPGVFRHRLLRFAGGEAAEGAGVHHRAGFGEGAAFRAVRRPGVVRDHHRADGKPVLPGELVIAFVVGGDRHDRAGPVLHEDIVGDEDGDLLLRKGIHRPETGVQPGLPGLAAGRMRLPGALPERGADELRHGRLPRRDRACRRVLRRQQQRGGAVDGVHPGGEHRDISGLRQVRDGKADLRTFGTADPVSLQDQHLLRPPRHPIHLVEQLLGVVGDPQEPLREFPREHHRLAPPAAPGLDLFVGEHRFATRAPVHHAVLPVGEAPLPHLQEEPLVPAVIRRVAGGELALPVVAEAEAAKLAPHVPDVPGRPVCRVRAPFEGRVLRRQPESVPADGMHHGEAAAPVEAGHHIPDRVIPDMAHVDAARGIGQHLEAVEPGPFGKVRRAKGAVPLPALLPLRFDALMETAHGRRGGAGSLSTRAENSAQRHYAIGR